jgi:NAD(P)-dependent dehydrogenase (short-subunit alcohol dehydrogenase family)
MPSAADVTDTHQMGEVLGRITRELGAPEVVIHNAVGGAFGNFQEIDPAVLERNFQVNVMALLHLVRRTAPAMIEAGRGAIIVTGNTSALRGKANFAGFAPSKAAQRVLTESIARELGPKGIHVAYIVIDAVIDVAWTRKMRPDARRLFHPAARHRGGGLAHRASAALGLVLQCRDQAVRRAVVRSLVWRFRSPHHFRGRSEMRTSEPKPH